MPHVEAILQFRQASQASWDAKRLGSRIYVPTSRARDLLLDLESIGVIRPKAENDALYDYRPATPELAALLDQLAKAYSEQLVAITRLIHDADERKAAGFAAAFLFRKAP